MRKAALGVIAVAAVAFWLFDLWKETGAPAPLGQDQYLVLAVSWTPSWCAVEGDARGAARCAPGAGSSWLVHGLWPQYQAGGWPEFCDSPHPAPSRAQTAAMVDIMGDGGLAAHQWRKHGSCMGLDADAYFATTRRAFEALVLPETISAQTTEMRTTPAALLAAFRAANPAFAEDMAVLTCRDGLAQELRLCLDAGLRPQSCDADLLARACRARSVTLPARP